MADRIIGDFGEDAPRRYVREGPVTILGAAEEEVSCGVEAQTGHSGIVGTYHLGAWAILSEPDTDGGVGRRSEHHILQGEENWIGWKYMKNLKKIQVLKPHCPTCSYLLPLYRELPQSVPIGPPWSSISYVIWELSWWDSYLPVTSLCGLIPPSQTSTDGL